MDSVAKAGRRLFALAALALAACGAPNPPAAAILTDLHDVEDLRAAFNQDAGTPRLVLLFSPT